ncbi:type II toxin-antitoxin system RelE/ParE family toxin [Neorhizobium alkalisoli]|uniref:Putative addiction module killer protein n=1 Tax=Neorhizobium alkalisoli TaxID=528178 RepID=A0A561QW33_9HYPH|nr:type II toxin-antitoxin system RelE/ParE family toxin [Neorhizobium alkalisoli]TWF54580.1 putative addiction module killer protein [Neorhizobium alkalisoli]
MRIIQTPTFRNWLSSLKDKLAVSRIAMRIERARIGNLGDVKPVGGGVSELRIPYGPGYRVYCLQRGDLLVILLCGGDKSSQQRDIAEAKRLAKDWKD